MSSLKNAWVLLVIFIPVILLFSAPIIGEILVEADLSSRKDAAAGSNPEQIVSAVVLSHTCAPSLLYMHHYYVDFLLPPQEAVVSCEVSRWLYNTLKDGQSGLLTYQGTAFRSFLRNGETLYDKH